MKNIFRLLFIFTVFFLFNNTQVYANTPKDYIPHRIPVQFDEDFSSENPPSHFIITFPDEHSAGDNVIIEKGTKVYLETIKVSNEKRGKLNATVTARLLKIYVPSTESVTDVSNPDAIVKFSKYNPIDYKSKSIDAGIFVANQFFSYITYPAHFVKGAIQNKEDNRLRSGLKETYESSVISYVRKGEPLILKKGDLATLTYYTKNVNKEEFTEPDEAVETKETVEVQKTVEDSRE